MERFEKWAFMSLLHGTEPFVNPAFSAEWCGFALKSEERASFARQRYDTPNVYDILIQHCWILYVREYR